MLQKKVRLLYSPQKIPEIGEEAFSLGHEIFVQI